MKKLYVLAGALMVASGAFAQGHELFFSAYNEGAHPSTGNNTPPGGGTPSAGNEKAIQIFNPTTSTVNMNQYSIARYSNGSTTVSEEEKLVRNKGVAPLNNNLTSADVFVYGSVDATLNQIVNVWDQQAAGYTATGPTVLTKGGAAAWNGNDAVVLRRWTSGTAGTGTPVIVDIFGVIGEDPVTGDWRVTSVVGGQTVVDVSSKNMSLNRKGNISSGVKTNPNPATYSIGNEWEMFSKWNGGTTAADYFAQDYSNLAGHATMYTGGYGAYLPLGVLEDFNKAISVFPNPASQSVKIKIENTKVSSITILNAIGQNIKVSPIDAAQQELVVDITSLKPGLYFVKFVSGDDYRTTIYKELLVN